MKKHLYRGIVVMLTALVLTAVGGSAVSSPQTARESAAVLYGLDAAKLGAAGDGKTDNTQILKTIISENCADGGTVYFPDGVYRIDGKLLIPEETELCFSPGASLLLGDDAVLTVNGTVTAGHSTVFSGGGRITGMGKIPVGDPCWFGAKGDGKTDDTQAFQKTIDLFREILVPYSGEGYVISNLKISRQYTFFHGESPERKAKLVATSGTENLITICASNIDVQYLSFEMGASPKGTCLFYDDSGAVGFELCNARYIDASDAWCVVRDADHPTNLIVTSKFENFRCINGRGTAISVSDMWGFIFMSDMVLDYSGTAERHGIKVGFPGFKMKDNAGALITNVKVIGDPKGNAEGHGFQFHSSAAVWMREISAENCSGCGIDISASWAYLLNSSIRNCNGTGVYATRCFTLQIENTDIICPDNHSSDLNGIFFGNGSHNQICNVRITGAGANGVFIQGATNNTVCGLKADSCGGYGLLDYGALTAVSGLSGEGNGKGLLGKR